MHPRNNIAIRLVQMGIVLGAIGLFGFTLWENLTPSGVLEVQYDFNTVSPFITSLLPGDRALAITRDAAGVAYQAIIGDPVYFRLRPPRHFDRADIAIRFQNDHQPESRNQADPTETNP